jgi:tetratricopeptide (TPR) repeat protein
MSTLAQDRKASSRCVRGRILPTGVAPGVLALAVAALAAVFAPTAPAEAARPDEVISWRHRILPREQYVELARAWEAYVQEHTQDATAWVEWGDALRYSGDYAGGIAKYARAVEIDSLSAPALAGYVANAVQPAWNDPVMLGRFHRQLVRAAQRSPGYADLYYTLYITSLMIGDESQATECLRRMIETGDMPVPLLEYGYNMLSGAAPHGIILTNGDNDTYPPLACQSRLQVRNDVTIVNLSLLNTQWYIRRLRDRGVPITLDDAGIAALQNEAKSMVSDKVQRHIFDNLARAGWPRPLYYSVTVPEERRTLPCALKTEGLLYRLVPAAGGDTGGPRDNLVRSRELLDTVYRIDSLTDPLVDWTREASVARGAMNVVHLLAEVGLALEDEQLRAGSAEGQVECPPGRDGGTYLHRAVRIARFHGVDATAEEILAEWAQKDPADPLLPAARALRGKS